MPSFATEQKSYTDLVMYHADPVMAKLTLTNLSLPAALSVGDVVTKDGIAFTATDTTAYVVAVPASVGDTYLIVIGSGCVLNPAAINTTAQAAAYPLITAAGNRIANANTLITE